jgi:hypothetical protein
MSNEIKTDKPSMVTHFNTLSSEMAQNFLDMTQPQSDPLQYLPGARAESFKF